MSGTILFRCDASADVGLGHLVRCLAVAGELKGRDVVFASGPDPSNDRIAAAGYRLLLKNDGEGEENFVDRAIASQHPRAVVLDTKYPYDEALVARARVSGCRRVVVIDNICPGLPACDAVVFPNAHADLAGLPPGMPANKVRAGPGFVILREDLLALRPKEGSHHRKPVVAITTGGSDPTGVMLKVLPWLAEMGPEARFVALTGADFKHKDKLERMKGALPENVTVMPYDVSEIGKADVVVCTFGMSIYEMVYLGKPTICISHSPENARGAKVLSERYGVILDAGYIGDLEPESLRQTIEKLLPPAARAAQARRCRGFIDGRGARRVASIIEGDV